MYDLIIRGGRVIDPANDRDQVADVAFRDGLIAAFGPGLEAGPKTEEVDASGQVVVPGLIDLHAHVYYLGSPLGVDPVAVARRSGTTTFIDAGSAGASVFAGFRKFVIEPSPVRILAFLNVAYPGIFANRAPVLYGECFDVRFLNAKECLKVARQHADLIPGIKVRIGSNTSDGIGALDVALEVAAELEQPVMTHIGPPPPSSAAVLDRLRPGDILTHCCRPFPNAPVLPDGEVIAAYREARARGVVLDVGHGQGSFGFRSAKAMVDAGFAPDVISSDVHQDSIDGPAFDVLETMSKFLNLGCDLPDVVRMTTVNAARAIGHAELGHLGEGAAGDATVLEVETGSFEFMDVIGESLTGDKRLAVKAMVVGGQRFAVDGGPRTALAAD